MDTIAFISKLAFFVIVDILSVNAILAMMYPKKIDWNE
jgi:hypothetical protein